MAQLIKLAGRKKAYNDSGLTPAHRAYMKTTNPTKPGLMTGQSVPPP